jgi:catechol 2,3-dioxygenase-like lactoylglutathione lyase family enzyme
MITSIHTLIYSDDPPATRAFLRDVIGWPFVEAGGPEPGWLIFGTGPSEMGVHPTHAVWEGETYDYPRHHEIALMCDDIEATRADLEAKGATFGGPVTDEGLRARDRAGRPGHRSDPALRAEARDRVRAVAPRQGAVVTVARQSVRVHRG